MKNSIFLMTVASALMLTACSSENDVLQNATQSQQTAVQERAVGFDIYTPAVTNARRAGQAGTMTTGRLQRTEANGGGFGVYSYLVEDTKAGAGDEVANADDYKTKNRSTVNLAPNFMVNEKVLWNTSNQGWYYDPLKYWPNETDKDSQTTPASMEGATPVHLDRLTFFAYAPYVSAGVNEPGITQLTNLKGYLDTDPTSSTTTGSKVEASVGYKASLNDPEKAVDLLWGVAPAGGLSYTAVNGRTVTVPQGEPLIDMVKPDVNTNMKFLFQHALARIGINVVAAVDQVSAGGTLDSKTKITIAEVSLKGMFGETGILNLDNTKADVANWVDINGTALTSSTTSLAEKELVLSADGGTIAPWLRYKGVHTFGSYSEQDVDGVTTSKQDLFAPRYFQLDAVPAYSPTKQYYSKPKATYKVKSTDNMYKLNGGNYEKVTTDTEIEAPANTVTLTDYYTLLDKVSFDYNVTSLPDGYGTNGFYKLNGTTYEYQGLGNDIPWSGRSAGDDLYTFKAYQYKVSDLKFVYDNKASSATYTVAATDNIYELVTTHYTKVLGTITAPAIGTTTTSYYELIKLDGTDLPSSTAACPSGKTASSFWTVDGNNFTYVGLGSDPIWGKSDGKTYWEITSKPLAASDIPFAYADGTYYDVERNYFMVVPTNNVKELNHTTLTDEQEKALRTVKVKIKYYVTTEDDKVKGNRTQTENIIEKDVLFPSMANGKSYMLNLVLGLTSVKMEAEVDDWKVINVNADLPQNTAE